MIADIQMNDSIAHGTLDGYNAGCRGSHCVAEIACEAVQLRYRGDYGFRKAIDAGSTAVEIVAAEAAEAARAVQEAARAVAARREALRVETKEAARERRNAARKAARAVRVGEPTTELQRTVKALHGENLTDLEIAGRLGRSRDAIKSIRTTLRLKPNVKPTLDDEIRKLYGEGLDDGQIARQLKKKTGYVGARRRHMSLPAHRYRTPALAGVSSSQENS